VRRAGAAAHAIDQASQDRVEVTPVETAQGPPRAHRAAPDPRPHRARIAAASERVQVADAGPGMATRRFSGRAATSPTVVNPDSQRPTVRRLGRTRFAES
jgi:hypothetical protein